MLPPPHAHRASSRDDPPITGVADVIPAPDRNDTNGGSVGFAVRGPFNWIDLRRPQIYAGRGRMLGWRLGATAVGGSPDLPSSFVDIELYRALASHFQQQGLAGFLI